MSEDRGRKPEVSDPSAGAAGRSQIFADLKIMESGTKAELENVKTCKR